MRDSIINSFLRMMAISVKRTGNMASFDAAGKAEEAWRLWKEYERKEWKGPEGTESRDVRLWKAQMGAYLPEQTVNR